MLLDSVALKTFTGTLTSPNVSVPFQIERGAMRWGYPGSVEEVRELLDRRLLGHALLLARVAQMQQADRQLVVREPERGAAGRGLHHRDRAPVAGEPARVCAQQHDVGRDRGREHVLVVLLAVAGLLGARGDQRRGAVELAA